jgi:DNA mismatch endonuclease (patch repair protein)
MADCFDKATRSRIMRAIKSRNTTPERRLLEEMQRLDIDALRLSGKGLPGTPDFVVGLLCIFVHGCFWHLCRRHYKAPASAGWRRKMDANRRRDIRVRRKLRALGWRTMVVWEHERPDVAASRVQRRLERMRRGRRIRRH